MKRSRVNVKTPGCKQVVSKSVNQHEDTGKTGHSVQKRESNIECAEKKDKHKVPMDDAKASDSSSVSISESVDSGVQGDNSESIDGFIEELEELVSEGNRQELENRSKSAPTGTTDATGSIAHALKSLLIEERASSQEFLRTVNTWQRSPELQEVRQMVPNNEETLRQQWYQHRFKRFSPSKQKRSSVAERLQRRKERLRTNSDQTTG